MAQDELADEEYGIDPDETGATEAGELLLVLPHGEELDTGATMVEAGTLLLLPQGEALDTGATTVEAGTLLLLPQGAALDTGATTLEVGELLYTAGALLYPAGALLLYPAGALQAAALLPARTAGAKPATTATLLNICILSFVRVDRELFEVIRYWVFENGYGLLKLEVNFATRKAEQHR